MLTAVSLFSGMGGLCEGVRLAGFDVKAAVELDTHACLTYARNFPETQLFEGSVDDFLPNDEAIRKGHLETYVKGDRVDLVFGGPPCQGFSQIGPRQVGDPRNANYRHLIRVAVALKAPFILMENVPNMLLMERGLFRQRITADLRNSGYNEIEIQVLNAADFGVPQARKRVFILASSRRSPKSTLAAALADACESLARPMVTVSEALADLPQRVAADSGKTLKYPRPPRRSSPPFLRDMRLDMDGAIYSAQEKQALASASEAPLCLHNHHTKEIQERRLALIRLLKPGAKADSLPRSVWDNARPEKWRRFHPDQPAHTLMAQMHRDLSEWIHPKFDRWITVREALRLQCFHDGFIVMSSEWQQFKQVGNAVPPLLGRVPAAAIALAAGVEGSVHTKIKQRRRELAFS